MSAKRDLDVMSKLELLDYAKRAKYMLGKNYHEMQALKKEIEDMKLELFILNKKLAQQNKQD